LSPLGNVENDVHLGVEFGCYDGGPSNGVEYKIIVYMDTTA